MMSAAREADRSTGPVPPAVPGRGCRGAPRRGLDLAAACTLLAATWICFWPVAGFDFVNFDDGGYVVNNPQVRAGLTRDTFVWAFRTTQEANWHPLTWLSLLLNVELFGLNPGWFHIVNLLLHAASGIVLYLLLGSLTGMRWRSAAVAAGFLLHPLHVESVAWIAERKDVLSGLFFFLTVGAYARHCRRPGWGRALTVWLVFALGLLAKPILVTVPLVLLVLDFWPLGRRAGPPGVSGLGAAPPGGRPASRPWLGLLLEKTPLFLLAAVSGGVTLVLQYRDGVLISPESFPLLLRGENALFSAGWYLARTLWPAGLTFFYAYPESGLPRLAVFAAAAVLAAVTASLVRMRVTQPALLAGWSWFLVVLAPMLGLLQSGLQGRADRYSYLPLTGVFLGVAWGVGELSARRRPARVAVAGAGVLVLGVLMAFSRHQVGFWRDSRTLSLHALAVQPDNWLAHEELGVSLMLQGRPPEALAHLRRARELEPDAPQVHYNLGWALERSGELEQAARHYREAVGRAPRDERFRIRLGVLLSRLGRHAEAVAELKRAAAVRPASGEAHLQLAHAYLKGGDRENARRHFQEALRLDPGSGEALFGLGSLRAAEKQRHP